IGKLISNVGIFGKKLDHSNQIIKSWYASLTLRLPFKTNLIRLGSNSSRFKSRLPDQKIGLFFRFIYEKKHEIFPRIHLTVEVLDFLRKDKEETLIS
ncbi:MAG: hypothetical protein ACFFE8_17315, partial [Candidatus Heimdallarchaeota archaeon]